MPHHDTLPVPGGAPIKLWTRGVPVDAGAIRQLTNAARLPIVFKHVAAMPDVHLGKGATVGVLFKNTEAIELLRHIDTLGVDKTGTLTEGKPALTDVTSFGDVAEGELLAAAEELARPAKPAPTPAAAPPALDAVDRKACRTWALTTGRTTAGTGPLPHAIVTAWIEAGRPVAVAAEPPSS